LEAFHARVKGIATAAAEKERDDEALAGADPAEFDAQKDWLDLMQPVLFSESNLLAATSSDGWR
jgi:hypothetical protein